MPEFSNPFAVLKNGRKVRIPVPAPDLIRSSSE